MSRVSKLRSMGQIQSAASFLHDPRTKNDFYVFKGLFYKKIMQ